MQQLKSSSKILLAIQFAGIKIPQAIIAWLNVKIGTGTAIANFLMI